MDDRNFGGHMAFSRQQVTLEGEDLAFLAAERGTTSMQIFFRRKRVANSIDVICEDMRHITR